MATAMRAATTAAAASRGLTRLFSSFSFIPPPPKSQKTPEIPPAEPNPSLFVSGKRIDSAKGLLLMDCGKPLKHLVKWLTVSLSLSLAITFLLKVSFGFLVSDIMFVAAKVVTDRVSGSSKGFGFVRYVTTEQAAAGIQGMDGKFLDGWVIFAEYARPRAPPLSSPDGNNPPFGSTYPFARNFRLTYGILRHCNRTGVSGWPAGITPECAERSLEGNDISGERNEVLLWIGHGLEEFTDVV
ncbi:Organelle RRM domain-containing protein [Drosera capensis]